RHADPGRHTTRLKPAARSPLAGDLETQQSGSGISLYGIREYRDGGPLHSICWKKSAGGDEFFVKEFEADIRRRVAFGLRGRARAAPGLRSKLNLGSRENSRSLPHSLLLGRAVVGFSRHAFGRTERRERRTERRFVRGNPRSCDDRFRLEDS